MAQLQCPSNYVPLQQVTADNLNKHVNNATLQPGAIHEQTVLGRLPVLADEMLIWDSVSAGIRRTTISDVIGAGASVNADSLTTSLINPKTNFDIVVTSSNGVNQTSKTFSSGDGINVNINSIAHGIAVGSIVVVTASDANYSGEYQVLTTTVDSFTYMLPAAVTAAAGSCSYYRKGIIRTKDMYVEGNETISGNLKVTTNAWVAGTSRFDGAATFNGNTNITGNFNINGNTAYVLTEVVQTAIPYAVCSAINSFNTVFTLSGIVKPADEIWEVIVNTEASVCTNDGNGGFAIMSTSTITPIVFAFAPKFHYSTTANIPVGDSLNCSFIIPIGTAFGTVGSPESFNIRIRATTTASGWSIGTRPTSPVNGQAGSWNTFTIKKYKTA